MNTKTQSTPIIGIFQLQLLKMGMVLSLAAGICFLLFACGSPKTSDSTAMDSTSLSTDSITTTTNGADTTVALDSVPPVSDTSHK